MKSRLHRLRTGLFWLAWLSGPPAWGHDLQYELSRSQAVIIKLFYADATPFSFESYEIAAEGEPLPVQVGRTDAQGRIAFLPDRAGRWRLKVISEDGHGLDVVITTEAEAQIQGVDRPLYERYGRVLVGMALILGVFGFVSLFIRKRNNAKGN